MKPVTVLVLLACAVPVAAEDPLSFPAILAEQEELPEHVRLIQGIHCIAPHPRSFFDTPSVKDSARLLPPEYRKQIPRKFIEEFPIPTRKESQSFQAEGGAKGTVFLFEYVTTDLSLVLEFLVPILYGTEGRCAEHPDELVVRDCVPSCAPRPSASSVRVLVADDAAFAPPLPGRPRTTAHHLGMKPERQQRTYDHRLVRFVQDTGDMTIATRLGVPRSTAAGWIRRAPRPVVAAPGHDASTAELRSRVARLERRVRRLTAVLRILLALVRILQPDLKRLRVPRACDKSRLLRAVDRSRGVRGLGRNLRIVGLSPSRLNAWRRAAQIYELEDESSCPNSSPHRLTAGEVAEIREMVTSPQFRHVPTGRLAILAQRIGRILASPTTWYRLVRERGWRRPRLRVHPEGPKIGIRANEPNEVWHIDTTVIRLLDGTRAYLHAVIDNFSRRILSWQLNDRFDTGTSAALLLEAGKSVEQTDQPPTVMADGGVENYNGSVDELIASGLLRRVLAMTEIRFSNSLIEAWWRALKHQWLFLHQLDSVAKVRKLVDFYVEEHNARLPHSAFCGQTPDEMYFGTGDDVPAKLADARQAARQARLQANRARQCVVCA